MNGAIILIMVWTINNNAKLSLDDSTGEWRRLFMMHIQKYMLIYQGG
jgi:hypothetical protein